MKTILTTTRSLFKFPQLGSNSEAQLEIDLDKLSIWRGNMALKALAGPNDHEVKS